MFESLTTTYILHLHKTSSHSSTRLLSPSHLKNIVIEAFAACTLLRGHYGRILMHHVAYLLHSNHIPPKDEYCNYCNTSYNRSSNNPANWQRTAMFRGHTNRCLSH